MVRAAIKKLIKDKLYKHYLNNKGSFRYYEEKIHFPANSTTFKVAIASGVYEFDILQFIIGNVKENSFYLDIGANIGLMSIPVLKELNNVQVISVEASPTTFAYLNKTRESSKYKDRWNIINKAISDVSGSIDFHVADPSNGAYDSMRNTNRTSISNVIKIPGITLDSLWNEYKKPDISFIKSDIEGADLLALRGGKECIGKCKPLILLEWNKLNFRSFDLKDTDLLNFCKEIGYQCYSIPALVKIDNDRELHQHSLLTENFMLMPI